MQPKVGGKSHPKLNTSERPIANKYREGKMKRTLRRESKAPETVGREAMGADIKFRLSRFLETVRRSHKRQSKFAVSYFSVGVFFGDVVLREKVVLWLSVTG